jgi:hypothetical protein
MGWPKGKPRGARHTIAVPTDTFVPTAELVADEPTEQHIGGTDGYTIPADWHPGMLLNVRNSGDALTITLYPEEFDYRKPERALRFTNYADGQNFISTWYSRQSHDPRAR